MKKKIQDDLTKQNREEKLRSEKNNLVQSGFCGKNIFGYG